MEWLGRVAFRATLLIMLVGLCLIGTPWKDGKADSSSTTTKKKTIIDGYLKSAFRANSQLYKFSIQPRVNLVCNERACSGVVEKLKEFLPKEVLIETATAPVDDFEVQVFLGHEADNEYQKAIVRTAPIVQGSLITRNWGEPGCLVHQTISGFEISKLLISIQSNGDEFSEINCAVIELVRGSGGQAGSSYSEYSRGLRALPAERYEGYKVGATTFLRIQWAPYLQPGMTVENAREFLSKHLK
jgi:hypothetical protein